LPWAAALSSTLLHHRHLRLRLLVGAARLFLCGLQAPLEAVEIGEHELGLHRLSVANGIDGTFHMGDVAVLEAAQHMGDGVDGADVAEELVAQAFAAGRAAHETGDVDEFELGRNDLRRFRELGANLEPLVGDGDAAQIGLDGAKGIVRRFRRLRRGERVEERALAHIGKTNDAAIEAHRL